jgi:glycosyltransferase involved in cell wall biosynthesis
LISTTASLYNFTNKTDMTTQTFPLVSIIIPNYNHGRYIADAIASILAQAYRRFEIIVVDDGSTDNSREIVAQYGDAVTYIWQENQGLSAARNTGIKAANGDYIALLDADDMYEPDFLSTLVFSMLANPDADGIYCGYQFVDDINRPLPGGEARSIPSDRLYQHLLYGNFLVPESILIHRGCYETAGPFDESLRACEDWDMWLRITRQFNIIGTNRILTRHRILPGSMSADPIRMINNRIAVLDKHFSSETTENNSLFTTQQRVYASAYLTSTVEYLQFGDTEKAYNSFKNMVQADSSMLVLQNTFYELGCGNQPKGERGHLATLDLSYNAQVLDEMLNNLFNDGNFAYLYPHKGDIFANAYFTLGLIAYNKADMAACRDYLMRALRYNPKLHRIRKTLPLFVKALLGKNAIGKLRRKLKAHPGR